MGGVHTCGRRPRHYEHPPPQGVFGTFPNSPFTLFPISQPMPTRVHSPPEFLAAPISCWRVKLSRGVWGGLYFTANIILLVLVVVRLGIFHGHHIHLLLGARRGYNLFLGRQQDDLINIIENDEKNDLWITINLFCIYLGASTATELPDP